LYTGTAIEKVTGLFESIFPPLTKSIG